MRQIFSLLSMLLLAGIMACNKEVRSDYTGIVDNGNINNGGNGNYGTRVKTDGYFMYEYDKKGRVQTISTSGGSTKYYYSDATVTEVTHFLNGTITGINIYKLRPNGVAYLKQNGSQVTNTYSTFEFSTAGELMLQVDTILITGSSVRHIYYRTGNRIDSIKRRYSPTVLHTHFFDYYTDRTNTVTNASLGKSFLGISDVNPVKSEIVRINSGSPLVTADYSYEYDAKNRIIKKTKPGPAIQQRKLYILIIDTTSNIIPMKTSKRKWWRTISKQRLFICSLDLLWIILVSGFMWFFLVIVL